MELDGGAFGPLWMREPAVAALVVGGIKAVERRRLCRVDAWVVMPNHVHLLLEPLAPVGTITQAVKGRTARQANLILGRTGEHFWQDESFDHWVRDDMEFAKIKKYIEENPVSARLVQKDEDWSWSSAARAGADVAERHTD
jgi:type I restriction enzyme R subunit/putative DNA methylase